MRSGVVARTKLTPYSKVFAMVVGEEWVKV